jgi:hypothetical protein
MATLLMDANLGLFMIIDAVFAYLLCFLSDNGSFGCTYCNGISKASFGA